MYRERFLDASKNQEFASDRFSITIRRADGTSETVLRIHIEDLRSTGLSFMPEGLEKAIDVQAMADLLTYLNSIQ